MRYYLITGLFVMLIQLSFFGKAKQETITNDPIYTYKKPDRDGTGKVYMGREISKIMNFMGMSWLERSTRSQEENIEITSIYSKSTDK